MFFPLIILVLLFSPYRVLTETQSSNILHCSLFEEEDNTICLRCGESYFLNQQATSCVQAYLPYRFKNCIQISDFNECMRCDCEYTLQLENNRCVKASMLSLVGCEVFKESGICIRPKPEYLLLQEENNTQSSTIRFGSGSNCEIFSVFYNHCLQCHSGFQLDKSMNCQRIADARLFNEFFSYFSSDGELQSRLNYFIPTKHGIYPQISNCEAYSMQEIEEVEQKDNSFTLRCSKCSAGRALTRSQTQCVKQPIALCRIVSDSDHSICEECFDNDRFYLSSIQQGQSQQQLCLPRQETNLDPTTRCLLFSQTSPICRKCMNGLESTPLFGCDIPRFSKDIQLEYPLDSFQEQFYHLFSKDSKCIFWLVSGFCGQCALGLTINDKGNCSPNFDEACQIPDSKGGCFKCIPLHYYSLTIRKCNQISQEIGCLSSFGFENRCDLCLPLHFFNKQGFCEQQGIMNCAKIVENHTNKCEICDSYYYYENSLNECVPIKNHLHCLFSDGIIDVCQQCQRNYILNDFGECVPSSIQPFDGQFCHDKYHYFNVSTNSCLEYTFFRTQTECFQFDRQDNKCVRCNYGFYVDSNGICARVQSCEFSDGISDFCYFSNSQTTFINEFGQVEPMSKDCDSNRIENICTTCYCGKVQILENNQNPINPQKDSDCIPNDASIFEISQNCEQVVKVDDSSEYVCQICETLFFPDQTGKCRSIQDFGCLVSSGRSKKCTLCKRFYKLNPSTKTCEFEGHTFIPFCEVFNEMHNKCVKCKSLFFIEDQQCRPIFDPDCEFSEGIYNSCSKCNNGIILNIQLAIKVNFQVYCSQLSMIITKDSPNQIAIHELHHHHHQIQLIPSLWKISIEFCIRYSTVDFSCLECKEGFYFNNYQNRDDLCSQISILNCIKLQITEWPFQICIQCAEGYFLSINGECVQIKNCLKFNGVCVECSKESFLMYGVCHEMINCKEQIGQQCVKCVSGYTLKDNEYVEESWAIFPQKCMKIPHCKESNGISSTCESCDNGFEVNNEICVRNKAVNVKDCEEQDDKNQCIKCRSLFVLQNKDQNNQCIRTIGLMNCSHSNGIDDYCISCSVLGYKLDENNQCKMIQFCDISNGIDWCVVCESGYIVNLQGECQEIDRKIENCIIYSFEKLTIRNWIEYDSAISNEEINNISNPQMIETTKPEDNLFGLSNSTNSLNINPSYGCIRCLNFFSVDKTSDYQQCLPLSLSIQENCAFSDGVLDNCAMCFQGFQERQSLITIYNYTCQLRRSKILTPHNIGCEIFDLVNHCKKCFDGFFFGKGEFCFPRNNRHKKCEIFNVFKDECQVCQSGYTLKRINQQIGDNNPNPKSSNFSHLICFMLQPEEIVQNCAKYQPNTNKCIKCIKRFPELPDLVEYVLNEKDNICEDALNLMCRGEIIGNRCQGKYYIPHCVDYDKSNGKRCSVCQNGFFLREERRECQKHNLIESCQVYSQDIGNICEKCEVLFYLAEGSTLCWKITKENCQIGEKNLDKCAICVNKQQQQLNIMQNVIDMNSGECILSPIQNCIVLKQQDGPLPQWICQQCRERYFQLSENKMVCIFRMVDANCKITDKKNVCLECKDGYLLNVHQDCIRLHLLCQIEHCLRYANNSRSEDMSCEQCKIPFQIEQNGKLCKVAVVDHIKDIQQDQVPDKLNKTNQDSALFESDFSLIIEILGFVIILIIIVIILVKLFLQNQTKLRVSNNFDNNPELSYTGETNVEIQICQPIQRGLESHDITISSSDVSEDITLHEN